MEFTRLAEALREPAFAALAGQSVRDYIDYEELAARDLPPGLTLQQTWELLGLVRHLGATTFPIPTIDGRPFWYSMTREGSHCLGFIRRHCRSDSALHRVMQEKEGQRFLVRSRIEEAVATCQLDGVDIRYARARRMLEEHRTPRSDAERLVLNSYEMLRELETPSSDLFSPSLVLSLYERLTHGVDVKGIARGQRRTNLAGTINPEEMAEVARQRGILAEICDFANAGSGDPEEPSAIKAYMVLSAMGYWRPLPDLNETVGRHMLRLFAVKRDYPVLGYLATSRSMLRWFDGKLRPGVTRFAELKRREVIPGTIDGTEDILTYLQLTTDAIGGLLGYIDLTKKQDAALAAALESEERLNYRQRSVLGRALSRPTTEFRIRAHQNAHHVVYQTARADLLDLEERGFLVREMHGKAFVFVPAPNLEQLLSHGG